MISCFHRMVSSMAALGAAMLGFTQQPFSLDTTFRTNINSQYVSSIIPVEDGKILVSGWMEMDDADNPQLLTRLNTNGTRDTDFPLDLFGQGKLIPLDDKVYVGRTQIVSRIFLNGELDPLWAEMNTTPYFNSLQGGDYHVFPDGRIVMSGVHTLSDSIRGFVGYYNFIWFTNTGYLDTTRIHRTGNGAILRFTELPDGKFLCSGTGTEFEGQPVDRIFRLNSNGSLDNSFQSDVNWGEVYGYLPLEDGRVYAGGRFRKSGAPDDTLHLVRFLPDGQIDPSFQPPHFSLGAIPDQGELGGMVRSITPFSLGRVIVTGLFQYANGEPRRGICMLDSTGTLLDVFEGHGVFPYTYQGFTYGHVEGIAPYGEDQYIIWGNYHGYGDDQVTDMEQRYVTRLHGADITVQLTEAEESIDAFRLHPNPTNTWVAITYDLQGKAEAGSVDIKDAVGHTVSTQPITTEKGQLVIDTRSFGAGMYTVLLTNAGQVIDLEKLVVQ